MPPTRYSMPSLESLPLFTQKDNYETSLKNCPNSFCNKGFITEHLIIYFPICRTSPPHCVENYP